MASSRHLGRVIVMQTLFAYEFNGGDPEAVLQYVSREFEGKISDLSFAYELLNGVLRYQGEIRDLIVKHAPQWPIEKIAPVDRATLEIGAYEMLHSKDVPAVVAIDEAIERPRCISQNSDAPGAARRCDREVAPADFWRRRARNVFDTRKWRAI